jgi:hypothetical protein
MAYKVVEGCVAQVRWCYTLREMRRRLAVDMQVRLLACCVHRPAAIKLLSQTIGQGPAQFQFLTCRGALLPQKIGQGPAQFQFLRLRLLFLQSWTPGAGSLGDVSQLAAGGALTSRGTGPVTSATPAQPLRAAPPLLTASSRSLRTLMHSVMFVVSAVGLDCGVAPGIVPAGPTLQGRAPHRRAVAPKSCGAPRTQQTPPPPTSTRSPPCHAGDHGGQGQGPGPVAARRCAASQHCPGQAPKPGSLAQHQPAAPRPCGGGGWRAAGQLHPPTQRGGSRCRYKHPDGSGAG